MDKLCCIILEPARRARTEVRCIFVDKVGSYIKFRKGKIRLDDLSVLYYSRQGSSKEVVRSVIIDPKGQLVKFPRRE